jgi:hypothetical protein
MEDRMKNFWKILFDFLKKLAIFVGIPILIIFVFILLLPSSKNVVGNPISIEEMEDQSLWRGVVVGNAQTIGGWAIVEVCNPPDSSIIFRLRVIWHEYDPAKLRLNDWKVGKEILFHRTGVNSSDQMRMAMFSNVGLFVSARSWKVESETFGFKIFNLPDRK